ncbi:MAG TPA: 5-formyltetrahydrofolate cyclo-ligase [Rhizomicrobium sp.]
MQADDPEDLYAWRKAERARLIAARRAMPLDDYQAATAEIMRQLEERLPSNRQTLVGGYWPFRREFDCLPYLRAVLAAGGQVALPVVVKRNEPLIFRLWTESTRMEAGPWNILHPAEGEPVFPAALVIPLVGFDPAGFRLGYGAGYYDATLASFAHDPVTIGVGFEFSCLDSIYPQPHDIPLATIITEKRRREFRAKP